MKIIDTHIHPELIIEFQKKKNNILYSHENLIDDASKNSVTKIFCVATEEKNFMEYLNLSKIYKEFFFTLGIHPSEVKNIHIDDTVIELKNNITNAKKNACKLVGIGETGIDFFHDGKEDFLLQKNLFEYHILLSIEYDLPLIIHTRQATSETYELLLKYKDKIKGVIHAFQDDTYWAKKFIDLNFKLGIGGVITYPKNDFIREAIKSVGMEHILLETDAPFLPIQSMRGKVNLPQYTYDIGIYVSELLHIDTEECFNRIYQNTENLFFQHQKK